MFYNTFPPFRGKRYVHAASNATVKKNKQSVNQQEMIVSSDITISWPCAPSDAVQVFKGQLTTWEREEIQKYSQIWYIGQELPPGKKINGDPGNPLMNFGFDDENGNYHK
ncbi:unnamed protein product, partial [Allacma fusca]